MPKKKLLWVSEASFLATGFSVISYEILNRLYQSGKYEIAEYGSYAKTSDVRSMEIPWKFYGAEPESNDQENQRRYSADIYGQFGKTLFEKVLLDFKPDIITDHRDVWMSSEWQLKSPYLKHCKYILCPTIDGMPQKLEWLDDYRQADVLLTYTKFGKDLIAKQAPDIKVFDVVRPGVNHDLFRPIDKKAIRKYFDLPENAKIILTVMRNQKRKLYPDLVEAFAKYINHCKNNNEMDLANNTYLYLHCSYPDVGFDIAKIIRNSGVSSRILVTYMCNSCGSYYPGYFTGESGICKHCGTRALTMPNTSSGISRKQLATIYNVADLYVQYSISEGLSCPIAEAKACGVPAIAVDYSAMIEQVDIEGCWKVNVQRYFNEAVIETEQCRALPDNNDLVDKMFKFFKLPETVIDKYSKLVRKDVVENYSFDRAAKIYENAIDSLDLPDQTETWLNPRGTFLDLTEPPSNLDNLEYVAWCIENIIRKPKLIGSFWHLNLTRGLNSGFLVEKATRRVIDRNRIFKMFANMAKIENMWEKVRLDSINTNKNIQYEIL